MASSSPTQVLPQRREMPRSIKWSRLVRWLRADPRYTSLLAVLGFLLPISGYTLKDALPHNLEVVVLGISAVLSGMAIFLSRPRPDVYNGKPEVDWAWDEMLRRAERSIEIVAGDIDWLHDDRRLADVIDFQQKVGCSISVVCKPPAADPVIRRGVASLLRSGASVRVRPDDLAYIPTTGILADRNDGRNRAALRVRVTRVQTELATNPKKIYWARRDLAGRDDDQLESWQALVDGYSSRSSPAVLLDAVSASDEKTILNDGLSKVTAYANAEWRVREVEAGSLWAWCLREDKLRDTASLVAEFSRQRVTMFDTCLCWSNVNALVLLPPIVEDHDGKIVVMEGAHRIWQLLRRDQRARIRVIDVSASLPLPGRPEPILDLPLLPDRLGPARSQHIASYREEYWRSFTPMEQHLKTIGRATVDKWADFDSQLNGVTPAPVRITHGSNAPVA